MKQKRRGIIMDGVAGCTGANQQLVRSILEIGKQGDRWKRDPDEVLRVCRRRFGSHCWRTPGSAG